MANETLTLIASANANAGAVASLNVTNIPQTGTDLYVIYSLRHSAGTLNQYGWRANGDASAPYAIVTTGYTGTSAYNFIDTLYNNALLVDKVTGAAANANLFTQLHMYIPNYTSANTKTITVEVNSVQSNGGGMYISTSTKAIGAITSMSMAQFSASGNVGQYSSVSVYSVTKGNGGATVTSA